MKSRTTWATFRPIRRDDNDGYGFPMEYLLDDDE